MRLQALAPFLRRWPLLGPVALLAVFLAALAVFRTATAPAGAQGAGETEVPAKSTGLSVDTVPGSRDVSVAWDAVDGAASYISPPPPDFQTLRAPAALRFSETPAAHRRVAPPRPIRGPSLTDLPEPATTTSSSSRP